MILLLPISPLTFSPHLYVKRPVPVIQTPQLEMQHVVLVVLVRGRHVLLDAKQILNCVGKGEERAGH